MNQTLKNRLVGVLVLLVVSAIVWPILFRFDTNSIQIDDEEFASEVDYIGEQISQLQQETELIQSEVLGQTPESQEQKSRALAKTIEQKPTLTLPKSPEDVGNFRPAKQVDKQKAVTRSPVELDSQGIPVSWTVQVATFSQWENALHLKQGLIDAGFKAYQKPEDKKFAGPYVIYVGPNLEKSKSQTIAKQVEEEFNTGKGLVKRFKGGLR